MARNCFAIIGGGPAGLMAADHLSAAGHIVTVYDQMPSVGRKLLLAGKSGLNITHSEAFDRFVARFGPSRPRLLAALQAFTPDRVRRWAADLGTETFVGSSGRVFPTVMKASPLLRAWLKRLQAQGVRIAPRHRWTGFDNGTFRFDTPQGSLSIQPDAVLLALGGASWPRLGSDAAWVGWLKDQGVTVADLLPANCGFDVGWSEAFADRFAGAPLKSVTARFDTDAIPGEFVISRHGIEGSLVYAHSAALRDRLRRDGQAALLVDLTPGRDADRLALDLARQGPKASFSNRLRKGAGLEGPKAALLRELVPAAPSLPAEEVARLIKALPIPLLRPRPIEEAISSAGGVAWSEIDDRFMIKRMPGLFAAGEMVDWEAPTGGYLLTACLASGKAAAEGMLQWSAKR